MSATTSYWQKAMEDLLLLAPLATALAGFDWSGLVPGVPGLLTALVVGALAKTLVGFAQDPHLSNWEDALGFAVTFLGLLASGFSSNPQFVEYGTIIGFIVKGLGFLKSGINIEDILLLIGALISGYGTITGNMELFNMGALISLIGKGFPSLGTGGASGGSAPAAPSTPSTPAPAG